MTPHSQVLHYRHATRNAMRAGVSWAEARATSIRSFYFPLNSFPLFLSTFSFSSWFSVRRLWLSHGTPTVARIFGMIHVDVAAACLEGARRHWPGPQGETSSHCCQGQLPAMVDESGKGEEVVMETNKIYSSYHCRALSLSIMCK